MLLMTSHTRSGGVGQGRASFARRVAVGAQRRALTDAGAEGISATDAPALCFQQVHAQEPPRLRAGTENTPIRRQLTDSTNVHAQQPVNTTIFAAIRCSSLISDTFPPGNRRFLCSSHSGVNL